MADPKSFTASTADDAEVPNLAFTLDGVYRKGVTGPDGATTWRESFEAFGNPSARIASAMRQAVILDERQRQTMNPGMVVEFIDGAMLPADAIRFRALVDDPDRLVSLDVLAKVFYWLAEQLTGRPTQPSGS